MFKSSKLDKITEEIEVLSVEIKKLIQKRSELYKTDILVQCETSVRGKGCGAFIPIGQVIYIQTHWYTRPRGCTGGDYWNQGEGQFICPICGITNRLHNREEYDNYKSYFKDITKTYDKS